MPQRREIVASAKVRLQQVAFDEVEAIAHTKFLSDAFRCGNHPLPIDCRHPYLGRLLRHRDSPDSGTRRKVDHAHLVFGLRALQMIAKLLRAGLAHRLDRRNEWTEEVS